MLVLSRKPGEHICIGDDVFVTVLSVRGDKIRLGLTAPRDVEIMRTELIEGSQEPSVQSPETEVPA